VAVGELGRLPGRYQARPDPASGSAAKAVVVHF
jgi:hypothetical protein